MKITGIPSKANPGGRKTAISREFISPLPLEMLQKKTKEEKIPKTRATTFARFNLVISKV